MTCHFLVISSPSAALWRLAFPHSPHLAICKTLSLWVPCTTVFAIFYSLLLSMGLIVMFCVLHLRESNSLAFFMLFSASFCVLCASTLWNYNSTFLLVTSSKSSNADALLKISFIMPSLPSPCMNCSVRSLLYSL